MRGPSTSRGRRSGKPSGQARDHGPCLEDVNRLARIWVCIGKCNPKATMRLRPPGRRGARARPRRSSGRGASAPRRNGYPAQVMVPPRPVRPPRAPLGNVGQPGLGGATGLTGGAPRRFRAGGLCLLVRTRRVQLKVHPEGQVHRLRQAIRGRRTWPRKEWSRCGAPLTHHHGNRHQGDRADSRTAQPPQSHEGRRQRFDHPHVHQTHAHGQRNELRSGARSVPQWSSHRNQRMPSPANTTE